VASCEFSFFFSGTAAEAVFEVVVQDEIQLLRREPVVFRQHRVDFVDDGFEVLNADGAAHGCGWSRKGSGFRKLHKGMPGLHLHTLVHQREVADDLGECRFCQAVELGNQVVDLGAERSAAWEKISLTACQRNWKREAAEDQFLCPDVIHRCWSASSSLIFFSSCLITMISSSVNEVLEPVMHLSRRTCAEGQRPANMPAQGNALGRGKQKD